MLIRRVYRQVSNRSDGSMSNRGCHNMDQRDGSWPIEGDFDQSVVSLCSIVPSWSRLLNKHTKSDWKLQSVFIGEFTSSVWCSAEAQGVMRSGGFEWTRLKIMIKHVKIIDKHLHTIHQFVLLFVQVIRMFPFFVKQFTISQIEQQPFVVSELICWDPILCKRSIDDGAWEELGKNNHHMLMEWSFRKLNPRRHLIRVGKLKLFGGRCILQQIDIRITLTLLRCPRRFTGSCRRCIYQKGVGHGNAMRFTERIVRMRMNLTQRWFCRKIPQTQPNDFWPRHNLTYQSLQAIHHNHPSFTILKCHATIKAGVVEVGCWMMENLDWSSASCWQNLLPHDAWQSAMVDRLRKW